MYICVYVYLYFCGGEEEEGEETWADDFIQLDCYGIIGGSLLGCMGLFRNYMGYCRGNMGLCSGDMGLFVGIVWSYIAMVRVFWLECVEHCNTLQCTAMHCNALQCNAMHCNALQHTATH